MPERLHRTWRGPGLLAAAALALWLPACGADPGPEPGACADPELIFVDVELLPEQVRPGESLVVRLSGASDEGVEVRVELPGASPVTVGLSGESASIEAPAAEGDHLVRVSSDPLLEGERCLAYQGMALLAVIDAPLCEQAGEVLEAGNCVPRGHGSPILGERRGEFATGEAAEGRAMVHPRQTERQGSLMVSCNTDSLAMIDVSSLPSLGDAPVLGDVPYAELLLSDYDLGYCEYVAWDSERSIAVLSSRGTAAEGAVGLSSWRLPEPAQLGVEPVAQLDTHLDDEGFGEVVFAAPDLLYAAAKPNRLEVFSISAEGVFTAVASQEVPGLSSAWGLAVEGDRLFLTDGGPAGAEGTGDELPAGQLFVFDLADPSAPSLLGSWATQGAARSVAVLEQDVVAVASGGAGVELVDVSSPAAPSGLWLQPTLASAMSVSYSDGYLLVADWDSLLLYDASRRGVLYLLGGSDLFGASQVQQVGFPWQGLFSTSYTALDGDSFLVDEFNVLITGQIAAGRRAPRLDLPQRAIRLPTTGAATTQLSQIVRNSGREPLLLQASVVSDLLADEVPPEEHTLPLQLIPPGESRTLHMEFPTPPVDGAARWLRYDSNDPDNPVRSFWLEMVDDIYAAGEPIPEFTLPMVNVCTDAGCTTDPSCFESGAQDRPSVYVFFSNW